MNADASHNQICSLRLYSQLMHVSSQSRRQLMDWQKPRSNKSSRPLLEFTAVQT
jgi:hypothetical protein